MSLARDALLREFRWVGGHADVWAVFRDADSLPAVVSGLVAPFRDAGITAVVGIESCGGQLVAISVMVDQVDSAMRSQLPSVHSLVSFADLPPCDE